MADLYTYTVKRKDLGKPCNFTESEVKVITQMKGSSTQAIQYVQRNPNHIDLDNIAEYSEHAVNTERVQTGDKVMFHKEGGWPQGIDPLEQQDQNKYRRRFEKDPGFATSVKELSGVVERTILQNNQIDNFEEYFLDEESEHQVENLSTKTLMLFKDQTQQGQKRSVSEISWHPEGPVKAAVSYAIMRFQSMPEGMLKSSFVWDLQNPNNPDVELETQSPITNLMYNPRQFDTIGAGCYNGLVAFWDLKRSNKPSLISPVEKSHHDPITHFQWLFSKTGSECVTTSTDGRVLFWDNRRLSEGPVETLIVNELVPERNESTVVGATCLEYNTEAGPQKYLIGTETGGIMIANKRPKKPVEITNRYGPDGGKHLGPCLSLHRSPPNPKYFLSVGDWSAKVWVEDTKSPIMRTKYHGSYLTDGCWSPTRNGVFFLIRKDGWMDVWDYFYRQNEIAFSHKVSETALTCIKINQNGGAHHNAGRLVAIGDQDGTVTLLELCDSLYQPQFKEKEVMNEMFERESRKEKNLETMKKQSENLKKIIPKDNKLAAQKWEQKKAELISEVDQIFSAVLKKEEENKLDKDLQELDSPKASKKKDDKKQSDDQGAGPKQEDAQAKDGEQPDQGDGQQQQQGEGDQQAGEPPQDGDNQGDDNGQQQQGDGGQPDGDKQDGDGQQQGNDGQQQQGDDGQQQGDDGQQQQGDNGQQQQGDDDGQQQNGDGQKQGDDGQQQE